MDVKEIRALSDEQILDKLEDLRAEMWQHRLNKATGELTDTNMFRKTRRIIARLKTVLRERQLAAERDQA